MNHMNASSVVAVTATHQRPSELSRLLHSLATAGSSLQGIVVVDNADDPKIRRITEQSGLRARYVPSKTNLGCGGGLRVGEQIALKEFPELTHIWILDDDAVYTDGALEILLATMESERADAAHPLVVAADGSLGWFPGLLDRTKLQIVRQRQTPQQFVARCGDDPIRFSWSQGIALLVTRPMFEQLGFHREDYWVRGEDLEFSLRITHRHRGIYVPRARVHHLPPSGAETGADASEYAKHRAMLQNLAYTSFRLQHGRPLIRTLPGNWLRFVRTWRSQPNRFTDAFYAFRDGAFLGRAAGSRIERASP